MSRILSKQWWLASAAGPALLAIAAHRCTTAGRRGRVTHSRKNPTAASDRPSSTSSHRSAGAPVKASADGADPPEADSAGVGLGELVGAGVEPPPEPDSTGSGGVDTVDVADPVVQLPGALCWQIVTKATSLRALPAAGV